MLVVDMENENEKWYYVVEVIEHGEYIYGSYKKGWRLVDWMD
jgi:hypothetical protein